MLIHLKACQAVLSNDGQFSRVCTLAQILPTHLKACWAVLSDDGQFSRLCKLAQMLLADIDEGSDDSQVPLRHPIVCLHRPQAPVVKDRHEETFRQIV